MGNPHYSPLSAHILYHDSTDSNGISHKLWVLDLLVLFLIPAHEVVHEIAYVSEDVIQELDGAPTSAHAENKAEVDMLALICEVLVAHQLDDLKELLDMQILLGCDDLSTHSSQ